MVSERFERLEGGHVDQIGTGSEGDDVGVRRLWLDILQVGLIQTLYVKSILFRILWSLYIIWIFDVELTCLTW